MRLLDKYLIREEDATCKHCHKGKPLDGRTVCSKCAKELESFRKSKGTEDKD